VGKRWEERECTQHAYEKGREGVEREKREQERERKREMTLLN